MIIMKMFRLFLAGIAVFIISCNTAQDSGLEQKLDEKVFGKVRNTLYYVSMTWQKGKSGNPRGRPRKSQKTMAQLRGQISEHLPAVIEVLADAAKEGDVQAARILVERCVPSMRAIDQNVNVNEAVRSLTDQELADMIKDFEESVESIH